MTKKLYLAFEDLNELDRATSYFEEDYTERDFGGHDTSIEICFNCKIDSCYYK